MLSAAAQAQSEGAPAAAATDTWPVAGRQGVVRFVIVPLERARDPAAYQQQIARLCEAGQTCFLNFYTNSRGVAPTLPLPDAFANEATAVYRHSMKQGSEVMRWSCRLQLVDEGCF